jgi:heme a synthase
MISFRTVRFFALASLACVFLVILAGSVVRTTGSGMGCPDWPRCYGYFVPPTDLAVVVYTPSRTYEKGQMVILNDTLWVANESFTAGQIFARSDWHKYPKHDYARFDATETWIEYINRLLGAFTGLPVLLMFAFSVLCFFKYRDGLLVALAFGVLLVLGFVAWLGKVVVDKHLLEGSITFHMLGSLALVALLLAIIRRCGEQVLLPALGTKWKWAAAAVLLLAFVQILLGTQVREEVDAISKTGLERSSWVDGLSLLFYFHRSFSLLVVATVVVLWRWNRSLPRPIQAVHWLAAMVGLEVMAGVVLSYLGMPHAMQPVHLLGAVGMFAAGWYLALIAFGRKWVI